MTVSTFQRTSFGTRTGADDTAGLDADMSALTRLRAQTSGTITAPAVNSRINRIAVDQFSGLAAVITGAATAAS